MTANREHVFRAPIGGTTKWLLYGTLSLFAVVVSGWHALMKSDDDARAIAAMMSVFAIWFLAVGVNRMRSFYLNSDSIGWTLGHLQHHIDWGNVEHVDWAGKWFPYLRIRTARNSMSVPFTVGGYVELYLLVAEHAPEDAFKFPALPLAVSKPKAWQSYLGIPLVYYAVIGGLLWGVRTLVSQLGADINLSASLAVMLAFICIPAGFLTAWWTLRSVEEMADRIQFDRQEIREYFDDTGPVKTRPAAQVVGIDLGQSSMVPTTGTEWRSVHP